MRWERELQLAGLLGILNHPQGQPVFYRTHRVERFNLHKQVDAGRRQLIDADNRSIAYRFKNVGQLPS